MSAAALSGARATNQLPSSGGGFAALSSEQFIKVLISELSNQDPLKPTDSTALMEQMSSLRNIESQLSLQKTLESLVSQNAIASASGLIGKVVAGLNSNNDPVEGMVMSIRVEKGKPVLELDSGHLLAADRVTEILDPSMT